MMMARTDLMNTVTTAGCTSTNANAAPLILMMSTKNNHEGNTMSDIPRYSTFSIDGSRIIEKADNGNFVFYSAHANALAAMRLRAEKAEAIVALARAVARGWEACTRLQNECQKDVWHGPKLLALDEARQAYLVAVEALQAALPKAGEA